MTNVSFSHVVTEEIRKNGTAVAAYKTAEEVEVGLGSHQLVGSLFLHIFGWYIIKIPRIRQMVDVFFNIPKTSWLVKIEREIPYELV